MSHNNEEDIRLQTTLLLPRTPFSSVVEVGEDGRAVGWWTTYSVWTVTATRSGYVSDEIVSRFENWNLSHDSSTGPSSDPYVSVFSCVASRGGGGWYLRPRPANWRDPDVVDDKGADLWEPRDERGCGVGGGTVEELEFNLQ